MLCHFWKEGGGRCKKCIVFLKKKKRRADHLLGEMIMERHDEGHHFCWRVVLVLSVESGGLPVHDVGQFSFGEDGGIMSCKDGFCKFFVGEEGGS